MAQLVSRSEQRRIYKQVEELAREAAALSNKDLQKFPGGPVLHEEILATRGLKGGAKKRQLKYLAKLMRQGPLEEMYRFISEKKGSSLHAKKQFHTAERIRDTLINETVEVQQEYQAVQQPMEPDWQSEIIDQTMAAYPFLDEDELRKVIFQYVTSRNKVHYRELFRMLKAAVEQQERIQRQEEGETS